MNRLVEIFSRSKPPKLVVSVLNPIRLKDGTQPQPDMALLRTDAESSEDEVPNCSEVSLVIEVSDSTLDYDRNVKIPLYAGEDIGEAWLANLKDDVIEIYTSPAAGRYQSVRQARRGERISPAHWPNTALQVDDILGKPRK